MIKTHEKSRFETMSERKIKDQERIVIQISDEKQYTNNCGDMWFLCETVDPKDYDRTTAEGRAAAAENELEAEIEAHKLEMAEAEEKIKNLEELLDEAQAAREQLRNANVTVHKENTVLYNALCECRRIFGELPKEIEELLPRAYYNGRFEE